MAGETSPSPLWLRACNVNIFTGDCNWTRTQNHLVRKRTLNHFSLASSKEFLGIQATIAYGFTPKCVRGMTKTYSHFYWYSRVPNNCSRPPIINFLKDFLIHQFYPNSLLLILCQVPSLLL